MSEEMKYIENEKNGIAALLYSYYWERDRADCILGNIWLCAAECQK